MSQPQALDHASAVEHLRSYLTAKKHQMHVARAAGFLLDASSGQLTDFLFDNRPVEPDPELDQLAEEMRLVRELPAVGATPAGGITVLTFPACQRHEPLRLGNATHT
ncbi:hypothetical protein AB0K68_36140 [Streptomyces sp. NPDC050698]